MRSEKPVIPAQAGMPLSGFADGMIISFGLSAALAINNVSSSIQLTVAVLVSLSGMVLFGIAVYRSGRDKGFDQSHHNDLFKKLGLNEEEMEEANEGIAMEHVEFIQSERPASISTKMAAFTAICFFVGYIIAYFPFLIIKFLPTALTVSFSLTPLILFLAGYLKNRFPGRDPLYGGLRYMFLGLLAAVVFCCVAWIF